MTINHIYLMVPQSRMVALRAFYRTALQPLGYTEMIPHSDHLIGFGSDYPYFWLKGIQGEQEPTPTHIAIDAVKPEAVDGFYKAALEAGGLDNGEPGIRGEMSKQPYYAAFIKDPAGNNIEAVCVNKEGRKK